MMMKDRLLNAFYHGERFQIDKNAESEEHLEQLSRNT